MKFSSAPIFSATVPGPWGVDSLGRYWYVVHSTTLVARRIGVVGAKRKNYFDEAVAEADRRNRKEN